MSFNIPRVVPATQTPVAANTVPRTTAPVGPAASSASVAAVSVDTLPSSPPPEVHDAMAVAAESYKQLAAANCELSFQINHRTGKLTVEVHDLKGNILFTVPATKALDVAAGGSLE